MQINPPKTKTTAPRNTAPSSATFSPKTTRKAARASAMTNTSAATRELICETVKQFVSTNYHALIADLIVHDEELAAMFAEIDRNIDASQQRTARLLTA